jgi:hypothetical protein
MSETFNSRYPGTSPFDDSPEDVSRFFGRDEEADELYLRVLSVPLLVQFGTSGLGKTSLLHAGLFPRLRQKPFLPVMVRLNTAEDSLIDSVVRSVQKSCEIEGLHFTPRDTSSLSAFLSTTTIFRDDLLLTPVLVFDQFEEVFTLRDAEFRASLAAELGALVRRPMLKTVISLREDYVGSLEEFSGTIPGLFQERLRLERFSERAARAAVTCPALLGDISGEEPFDSPRFELEPAALDALIQYLRGRSGVIEPIQLQLLCRHAETIATGKARSGDDVVRLTLDDFRGSQSFASVLENFYRDTLRKITPHAQRKHAARLCEEGLLGSDGHRLMLEERQILHDFEVRPETLNVLTQEKLIRREERMESVFYEISHDRLAESIFNARTVRLPRGLKQVLFVSGVAALVVVGLLAYFNWRVSRERNSAQELIGFLMGEQFLGEVRDMGSSALLGQVQEHLDHRAASGNQPSLLRGLALRGRGDVKSLQGDVGAAATLYQQALQTFEGEDADSLREIARAQERMSGAFDQQRKFDAALAQAAASDVAWRRTVAVGTDPEQRLEDCVSFADSLLTTGFLQDRLGQGDQALQHAETAVDIVSNVLFGAESASEPCRPVPGKAEPYPDAGAVRVLSRAALLRANVLSAPDDYEGAATLAQEARALMPASTSARKYSLEALSWRAYGTGERNAQRALDDYRLIQREAEELRRWDPDNRLWQRERAIALQMVGRGIGFCHLDQSCTPMPALEEAEAVILEAIATLRALAQLDANNLSLHADIFWAVLERADVLALKPERAGDWLEVLEQAERVHDKLATDPESVAMLAYLRERQAKALAVLGRAPESAQARQQSIAAWTQLAAQHPKHPLYALELRRARGEATAVSAIESTVRAVENPRHAIRRWPADFAGYGNLSVAYTNRANASRDDGERAAFLNAALESAQIAAWLAPDFRARDTARALLVARNTFGLFLHEKKRLEEALAMITEDVVVAEALVHADPHDSVIQETLGQAKCSVGQVRRELKQAGWEEAVRGGILHLQRATAMNRQDHWDELADWQQYLGQQLIADGRQNEGTAQYRLALASYRLAVPTDKTQKAIQELTHLTN